MTDAPARLVWRRPMGPRDPAEDHRTSTPLELLFDLTVVVAVAAAAAELHHAIAADHLLAGVAGYAVVFFAIWWAWMNFTWFASAYDTDDAVYRLLTVVQMAGVLVIAVGIPAAFERLDITTVVVGYAVMRVGLVAQWLRASREDPVRRATTRTYALGIVVVQVLWIALAFVPTPWTAVGFVALVVAELGVPALAESRGTRTTWHAEHLTERYGLLTLIVLGEVILGTTGAIGGALSHGVSASLVLLAVGGLLIVVGIWWTYFLGGDARVLSADLRPAIVWGYGHFLVFASIAAVGAGLEAAVEAEEHVAAVGPVVAAFAVAVPAALVLLVLTLLRRLSWGRGTGDPVIVGTALAALLGCAGLAAVVGVGVAVLLMGLVLTGALAVFLSGARRRGQPVS